MSLYERWHESAKRDAEWQKQIIEKYFNLFTYSGAFRSLLLWIFVWYVLWHIYDAIAWVENFLGLQYDPISPAKKIGVSCGQI